MEEIFKELITEKSYLIRCLSHKQITKVIKYLDRSNPDILRYLNFSIKKIYKLENPDKTELIIEFLGLSDKNNRYYELFENIIDEPSGKVIKLWSFIYYLDLSDEYIMNRLTLEINRCYDTNFDQTECYNFLIKWISETSIYWAPPKFNVECCRDFSSPSNVEKYLDNNSIQDLYNFIENCSLEYHKKINTIRKKMFDSEYGFLIDYDSQCSITEILYFGDYDYLFLDEIIDEDILKISELIGIKIPEYYVKILKSILDEDRYLEINNYLFDTHSLAYHCMCFDTFLIVSNTEKVYDFYCELSIFLEENLGSFNRIISSSKSLYISTDKEKIIYETGMIQTYFSDKENYLKSFKFSCSDMTLMLKNYYLNNTLTSITFFRKFDELTLNKMLDCWIFYNLLNAYSEYIDFSDVEYCDVHIVIKDPFCDMFVKYFANL